MDMVLRNHVGTECWVFINDVIVFSKSAEEHALRLENVLRRFDEASLQLHPKKCVFTQPEVQYLGFVLSNNGVSASTDNGKTVRKYPTPKNVTEIRAFLVLASFYSKLVPTFAQIAKTLTTSTRKDHKFEWGPSQREAFEGLKYKL